MCVLRCFVGLGFYGEVFSSWVRCLVSLLWWNGLVNILKLLSCLGLRLV